MGDAKGLIKINLPGPKAGGLGSKNVSLNISKVTEGGAQDRTLKGDPSGDSAYRAFEMARSFEQQRKDLKK